MTAIDRHFRLQLGRVWEEIRITCCPVEPIPTDAVASGEREREVSASSSASVEPGHRLLCSDVMFDSGAVCGITRRVIGSVSPLDGRSDAML